MNSNAREGSNAAPIMPNQVGFSMFGTVSAMITAVAATVVTLAMKSNTFVDKTGNMVIHAVSAAEHITRAGEQRAEIYANAIVKNGVLSEREAELKLILRTRALEAQELASRAPAAGKGNKHQQSAGNGSAQATAAP